MANNICVIASILSSAGIAAPACFAVGAVTGVAYWDAAKQQRDGPQLYAYCAEPAWGYSGSACVGRMVVEDN